jgi:MFS family permease
MRVFHAALNSVANTLFYSLVADYFPKNQRGFANSILQSANYVGIALSSISIIIIN